MKRILQIVGVVALTIFFLGLFLRNANLHDVGHILRSAHPGWVAVAFSTNIVALLLRTTRWRTVLDPDNPPPYYPTFFANAVGYMLSTVLPVRAADVARPALLSRKTTVRFSAALGTVLIERLLDLTMLLSLFVGFAIYRWDDFSQQPHTARWFFIVKAGAIACAILLVAVIAFMFGVYFFRDKVRVAHEWLGRFIPRRFRDSWMNFYDKFVGSLNIARHHAAFVKVLLCTGGIWLCLTSQFYFTVLALDRPLPFDASIFVNGITTVGLAIPTPGGVGGFHKACQLVLTNFYAFDVDSSVAVAVLFHIVGTIPVVVIGILLAIHEGIRWRDVTSAS